MASNISHWVPTSGFGQKTYQQCWFASYQMLYWSKGKNIDSIKDKLSKVIDFQDSLTNGLIDKDYHKCAGALELQSWKGIHFNQPRGFTDIGLTDGAEALLRLLKDGPLWVSRKISKDTYHIVVAKGYDDAGDGSIIYNNPYPGPKNAVEQRVSASHFARMITYATGSVQR